MIYPDGKYTGEWINDKRTGRGTVTLVDGEEYTGQWLNDKYHGHGTHKRPNGSRYEGEHLNGYRSGQGRLLYADGSVYEGKWLKNKRHGCGVQTYSNGDRYDGMWLDDKRNGHGVVKESSGATYKGEWKNDECADKRVIDGNTESGIPPRPSQTSEFPSPESHPDQETSGRSLPRGTGYPQGPSGLRNSHSNTALHGSEASSRFYNVMTRSWLP